MFVKYKLNSALQGFTYRIKHIWLAELCLEVCGPCQDQASNVWSVATDEQLHGYFSHLTDVVVTLLHTETGETQRGLTSTTCKGQR